MANTLRFKRGLASGIPTALAGEPLFTTDTFDLYIGNGTTNTRFQKHIASGATTQILRGDGSLYTFPLAISSPTTGQVLKYDGTNWVNDSDAGITGSGAAGQVAYFTGATTQSGSNNLFWDSANNRLGIGTNTPSYVLDLQNSNGSILARFKDTDSSHLGIVIAGDINAGWVGNNSLLNGEGIYYQNSANIMRFYTNSAERIRLHSSGNLHLGGSSDNGLRFQVTGDGFFSGSLGIGTTSLAGVNLSVSKTITGATSSYGILNNGVIQSDVTSSANYFMSSASSQNTVFTLTALYHFRAAGGSSFGSATVANQIGFNVGSSLTGATNNYGFYGDIASGTGRWNLYMNGTANNYMAGSLGIGTTNLTGVSFRVNKALTGGATVVGIYHTGQVQSDVTSTAYANYNVLSTAAASFTLPNYFHYGAEQGTIGAGSAVTNQYGFYAFATLTGATNNYGFYGNIASGTGRWNLYMNGTANNYMAGRLGIGITNPNTELDIVNTTTTAYSPTAYNLSLTRFAKIHNSGGSGQFCSLIFQVSGNNSVNNAVGQIHVLQEAVSSNASSMLFQLRKSDSSYFESFRINSLGNFLINGTSDTGERLQVNGTMRVSGASTFGGNIEILRSIGLNDGLKLNNTAGGYLQFINSSASLFQPIIQALPNGNASSLILKGLQTTTASPTATVMRFIARASDDSSAVSGVNAMTFENGTTSVLTIASNNAATFSSTVTGASFIPTSSTIPTNGMYLPSTNSLGFATNGTLDMTINSRGDIGVGVTPSTWSLGKSIEINSAGQGITSLQVGDTFIMNGVYYNTSQLRYANSTYAISLYRQFRGVHSWYYAPQGTIGNQVTFDIPMTLETTGNLLLGSTTDDTVNRLQVTGSGKFSSTVTSTQFNLSALNTAPATSSSTGTLGEIRIDADHIYVCTATNTWKRVAISTF